MCATLHYSLRKLFLVSFCLLSFLSNGQEHRIGVYQAYNGAYISDNSAFTEKYRRNGYHAGIQYNLKVKRLHFGAELAYIQRGFSTLTRYTDSATNRPAIDYVYYNLDYLALPLSVSYRGSRRFFGTVGLGLIPSFLIQSDTYFQDELLAPNPNGGPSKFDLGGQIELGAGFKFTEKWAILAKLCFFRSFTRINNDNYFKSTDFRNTGVSLGFSIEYRIK